MEKIVLSKHAKLRCKQQNIDIQNLIQLIENEVPKNFVKEINWVLSNNIRVTLIKKEVILVLTVISNEKIMNNIRKRTRRK